MNPDPEPPCGASGMFGSLRKNCRNSGGRSGATCGSPVVRRRVATSVPDSRAEMKTTLGRTCADTVAKPLLRLSRAAVGESPAGPTALAGAGGIGLCVSRVLVCCARTAPPRIMALAMASDASTTRLRRMFFMVQVSGWGPWVSVTRRHGPIRAPWACVKMQLHTACHAGWVRMTEKCECPMQS